MPNRYVVQLDILWKCELIEHPEEGTRKRGRLVGDGSRQMDGKALKPDDYLRHHQQIYAPPQALTISLTGLISFLSPSKEPKGKDP